MQIVCREREINLSAENDLDKEGYVVYCLEPFVGDIHFRISAKEGKNFKGFCSNLLSKTDSFTTPFYFNSFSEVAPNSYFILTQDEWGFTTYFCLSHQDMIVSLEPGDASCFVLKAASGTSRQANKKRNALLCVRGENMHQTINKTMELSLQLTGNLGKLIEDKLPQCDWLNSLGWESGASRGFKVSHANVLNAVQSLRLSGYQPGFVLINEGWQYLKTNLKNKQVGKALGSFEADPIQFPKGLKGLVDDLLKEGVKHIGVWHGMMGYRGGVHVQLAQGYDLPPDPKGRYFLGYDLGRTFQFYYEFYEYLRKQGITFIKVGDQGSTGSYCRPGMDVTMLYKNLQCAMQAAASIQFNSTHFNTDCLRNENLFYWTTSRFARTADDIDINHPEGVMQTIRNNLTNSLWLQHLMQPDYDAWRTNTSQSEILAVFHALSGSINVISDCHGEHNIELIHKMVLPCGKVLKADKPLTLCDDSVFIDPIKEKKIYKAFTYKGTNGILGAFNLTCGKRTLHGSVSSRDIQGLKGDLFAIFSHHNGFVGVIKEGEHLAITLKPNESDVITFSPVKNGIAVIGCYSYFLAPGPISEVNVEENAMHISSLVAAPLIVYCERPILEVRRNNTVIPWEHDIKRNILTIDSRTHISNYYSIYSIAFEA
jgi:raffinose synthase